MSQEAPPASAERKATAAERKATAAVRKVAVVGGEAAAVVRKAVHDFYVACRTHEHPAGGGTIFVPYK